MNSIKSNGLRLSPKLSGCSSLDALSITSDVLRCIQDVSQVVDLLLSTSSLKSNVSQSIFVHAISYFCTIAPYIVIGGILVG